MTELVSLFMWGLIPLAGLIFIPQTVGWIIRIVEERDSKVKYRVGYWEGDWADGFIITVLIGLGVVATTLMGMLIKIVFRIPPFI